MIISKYLTHLIKTKFNKLKTVPLIRYKSGKISFFFEEFVQMIEFNRFIEIF